MAFVGTTYVCQFLEPHEDGSSGDHMRMAVLGTMRWQVWGPHAMEVVGTTCDGSYGDHIRMSVLGTTCDGVCGDYIRMSVLGTT